MKILKVKRFLLNKALNFFYNVILVILIFLIFLLPIYMVLIHSNKDRKFKWEYMVKEYFKHVSNGLEIDGFQKIAGAFINYKNDRQTEVRQKHQSQVGLNFRRRQIVIGVARS